MYEEQTKKKRNGLKIVVENRNVYEGQYIKVTHVVYDGPDSSQPPAASKQRALPGWMGSGQVVTSRRRRPSGPFNGRLLT